MFTVFSRVHATLYVTVGHLVFLSFFMTFGHYFCPIARQFSRVSDLVYSSLGLWMRSSLIAAIYRKSLNLSSYARQSTTEAEIINLMCELITLSYVFEMSDRWCYR